jgi:hypothetical protein
MANASMTITDTKLASASVKVITAVWLSDDSTGAVNGTTTNYFDGQILGVMTVPGAGTPSNNYDVKIYDPLGANVELSAGGLMDRSNATTQYLGTNIAPVAASTLKIDVSNAGNAKNGTVYIWVR